MSVHVHNGKSPAPVLMAKNGWQNMQLGKYAVERHIGDGSAGRVFLAVDLNHRRPVAIKVISKINRELHHSRRLDMFLREARAFARIDHPNVVSVEGVIHFVDMAAIVMEYVPGGTLDDLIGNGNRLPVSEACRLVAEAAEGVACAHRHGIIHRDIKPANIMLTGDRHCKVTDFGASRAIGHDDCTIFAGRIVGTPLYVSPELIRWRESRPVSDIYALGVTLWTALTGEPTFDGATREEVYYKHASAPVPDIEAFCPGIPRPLADLLYECLEKNPEKRLSSAAQMARQLRGIRGIYADAPGFAAT